MERSLYPVDVIAVCNADGKICPLRMRLEGDGQASVRVDIQDVLRVTDITYVGAEAQIFLCRGTENGRVMMFELKYAFRSHRWTLLRRIS